LILTYKEQISSSFNGTIIDIETIGKFNQRYRNTNSSREYEYIQQVIFGFINREALTILYIKNESEIFELNDEVTKIITTLEKPFYAFNTSFEKGVLFHSLGRIITFEGELQKEKYESKARAIKELGISNYDDPFNDKGILCMYAWQDGDFEKAVAHNRACLLKERDILLFRGSREPHELTFMD